MTFGQEIRRARKQYGKSLRGWAKDLKISASYLSDIELGRRYPAQELRDKMFFQFGDCIPELPVCRMCGRPLRREHP